MAQSSDVCLRGSNPDQENLFSFKILTFLFKSNYYHMLFTFKSENWDLCTYKLV
jgi:hypothetical protein